MTTSVTSSNRIVIPPPPGTLDLKQLSQLSVSRQASMTTRPTSELGKSYLDRFSVEIARAEWAFRSVVPKKILFQLCEGIFEHLAATLPCGAKRYQATMQFSSYKPIELFIEALNAAKSNTHLSPAAALIETLVHALEDAIPYAKAVDMARISLYPELFEIVRKGDEVGLAKLGEQLRNNTHCSHPVERRLFDQVKAQIEESMEQISRRLLNQLSSLLPHQMMILPSGSITHEIKLLFMRQPDLSFNFYIINTGEGAVSSDNHRVLIQGYQKIQLSDLTIPFLKTFLLSKVEKIRQEEISLAIGMPIEIPKDAWGHKMAQTMNSCSVQSLIGCIRAAFYNHFDGSDEGYLQYKLLISLIYDQFLGQFRQQLEPEVAAVAEAKGYIRRRYFYWISALASEETFKEAIGYYTAAIQFYGGSSRGLSQQGKLSLLNAFHKRLALTAYQSEDYPLTATLTPPNSSITLLHPAYVEATLRLHRLQGYAQKLNTITEYRGSLSTRVQRAVESQAPGAFKALHYLFPTYLGFNEQLFRYIKPALASFLGVSGSKSPSIDINRLYAEIIALIGEGYSSGGSLNSSFRNQLFALAVSGNHGQLVKELLLQGEIKTMFMGYLQELFQEGKIRFLEKFFINCCQMGLFQDFQFLKMIDLKALLTMLEDFPLFAIIQAQIQLGIEASIAPLQEENDLSTLLLFKNFTSNPTTQEQLTNAIVVILQTSYAQIPESWNYDGNIGWLIEIKSRISSSSRASSYQQALDGIVYNFEHRELFEGIQGKSLLQLFNAGNIGDYLCIYLHGYGNDKRFRQLPSRTFEHFIACTTVADVWQPLFAGRHMSYVMTDRFYSYIDCIMETHAYPFLEACISIAHSPSHYGHPDIQMGLYLGLIAQLILHEEEPLLEKSLEEIRSNYKKIPAYCEARDLDQYIGHIYAIKALTTGQDFENLLELIQKHSIDDRYITRALFQQIPSHYALKILLCIGKNMRESVQGSNDFIDRNLRLFTLLQPYLSSPENVDPVDYNQLKEFVKNLRPYHPERNFKQEISFYL